jgi:DNA-binding MarR family transcriptional regulator
MMSEDAAPPCEPDIEEALAGWDAVRLPGPLLRLVHQRSHDLYTELVGRDGPTRQQIAVLIALYQRPGASQAELTAATGIDRNTLAEMLGRLVERGLVERRRAAGDGRAWELRLGPTGAALLRETMPAALRVQRLLLEPIPPELRETFLECLRRVAGIAGGPR